MLTGSFVADIGVAAILLMIAAHTLLQVRRGRFLVFDPLNFFWVGILVIFVQQPLTIGEALAERYSWGALQGAVWWAFASCIVVIAGYEMRMGTRVGGMIPAMPPRLSRFTLGVGAWAMVGVAVFALVYQIIAVGGLEVWAATGRGALVDPRIAGWFPTALRQVELALPIGMVLLLFSVQMRRTNVLARAVAWAAAGLALLLFLYIGSRSRTIMLVAGMIGAVYLPRHRNPPLKLLVPVGCVLLVVIPFLAAYRGNFRNLSFNLDKVDWSQATNQALPRWLRDSSIDVAPAKVSAGSELACVMATVSLVPGNVPYNYGYGLLEWPVRPIPRWMWSEGKPRPNGIALTPIMLEGRLSRKWDKSGRDPILVGPAFGFVGYWWAAGGPVALVIAGLAIGVMLRAIRNLWDRDPGNQGDMMLLLMLAPAGFFESSATPLFYFVQNTIAIVLVFMALRSCRGVPNPAEDYEIARPGYPVRQYTYAEEAY